MHRLLLLLSVLSRAIAPNVNVTEAPGTLDVTCCPSTVSRSTMSIDTIPPSSRSKVTGKPRRLLQRTGKADSPMLNYIFDSYATNNKHFHDKFRAPSFEGSLDADDTTLDADTGATVFFDCRVTSLRDKMVSWLKVSDNENLELLTIDLDTHTADSRYRLDLAGDNWRLALADARSQDSGLYCCQVSTHPPMLRRVKLTVHPPELKMSREAFLESGETLSLKCLVIHLNPGNAIPTMHWYRGNTTVPLDEVRGGVLIDTDHLTLTSQLQVATLTPEDAGNYTCSLESPIRMRAATRVHVLQGSSLAELQSGVKTTSAHTSLLLTSIFITLYKTFSVTFSASQSASGVR